MARKSKWDIPIIWSETINEALGLLSTDLWAYEFEKFLANTSKFEEWRKISELRKSCGVEGPKATVKIRRPPRYAI